MDSIESKTALESVTNKDDKYRLREKEIRSYFRRIEQEELSDKARKKRLWAESHGMVYQKVDDTLPSADSFSWKDVVNVRQYVTENPGQVRFVKSIPCTSCCSIHPHACLINEMKVYELAVYPLGLYIVPHALCPAQVLQLAQTSLEVYSKEEHTNLSNLTKLSLDTPGQEPEQIEDSRTIWERSCSDNDGFQRMKKLRWACLGYHYDWTLRSYQKDIKSSFPVDFAELCINIASTITNSSSFSEQPQPKYIPEAAIVNYYPVGSQMGGHIDDAEHDLEQPIISLSLGRSAIYLIGGQRKDSIPTAILVQSGDVIMMSKESRLCYHGIALVLSQELEDHCCNNNRHSGSVVDSSSIIGGGGVEEQYVINYLQSHRINLNVRQVCIRRRRNARTTKRKNTEGKEGKEEEEGEEEEDDNEEEAVWIDKQGSGYRLR